ncbi:MAG: DNA-processing protein DprA [Planctomycetia bacterium]|nr:DNA-processing protein DprA [Planctomycetia bacterium]
MDIKTVDTRDSEYPTLLRQRLGNAAPKHLHAIGNPDILRRHPTALICSIQCPGSVVIVTFDAIRELRDAGIVVVGGFHSPMEQECLEFLLRGDQPVIVSPAKGLSRPRLSAPQRQAIRDGRLLLLSMFGENVKRTTKVQAQQRNEFIAALAFAILIPHASPGGNAEIIAQQALQRQQPLFTIDDDENADLIQLGAHPYKLDDLRRLVVPGNGGK